MELIVGVNSYMTLEEADDIVKSNFIKSDAERVYWESLDNDDKSVLIYKCTQEIENACLYKGRKVNKEQTLGFPRYINGKMTDCPNTIKHGIIIQLLKELINRQSDEVQLHEQGVKSFADGTGASITFDDSHKIKVHGIDINIYNNYFRKWTITV